MSKELAADVEHMPLCAGRSTRCQPEDRDGRDIDDAAKDHDNRQLGASNIDIVVHRPKDPCSEHRRAHQRGRNAGAPDGEKKLARRRTDCRHDKPNGNDQRKGRGPRNRTRHPIYPSIEAQQKNQYGTRRYECSVHQGVSSLTLNDDEHHLNVMCDCVQERSYRAELQKRNGIEPLLAQYLTQMPRESGTTIKTSTPIWLISCRRSAEWSWVTLARPE